MAAKRRVKPSLSLNLKKVQSVAANHSITPNFTKSMKRNSSIFMETSEDTPRLPFTKDTIFDCDQFLFPDELGEGEFDFGNPTNGQFGSVQQCRHVDHPDLKLAMKNIKIPNSAGNDSTSKESNYKYIKRELDIVKKATHNNIIAWYGSYIDKINNVVHILMEFADGPTLGSCLQLSGRFPNFALDSCLKQTVDALYYLKTNFKVSHRDLKPSNIIFTKKGVLKLVDFGMAKISQTGMEHSKQVGAKFYMSPEMTEGDPETMNNFLSDVFSLGTTLLECAFGYYPYPIPDSDELKENLDRYTPGHNLKSNKEINQLSTGKGSKKIVYLERYQDKTLFEMIMILSELPDKKFPDFCRDDAKYFKVVFCDMIETMTMNDFEERISYEKIITSGYFKSIGTDGELSRRMENWLGELMH